MLWAGDGLKVQIERVEIGKSMQPQVTFTMKDDAGLPLEIEQVTAPRFLIGRLDVLNDNGSMRYFSYIITTATAPAGTPNAGAVATQATSDRTGQFTKVSPGKYVYTFKAAIKTADYDPTKTHTVSIQVDRTVNGKRFVANPLFHFVPDGSQVKTLRKVVTNDACNKCHTMLGAHGGGRKDVTLCLICHNPQTTNPGSGNTADMPVMIHKIHRGENLPSVEAGKPYQFLTSRGATDFSEVAFPMDIRNCQVCHAGEQGDIYKKAPSRAVCGSCHDNVNFQTGVGHGPGLPQTDDKMCTACHQPDGEEFGIAITGAHTIPLKSKKLKGLIADIVEIKDAAPGLRPTVRFNIKENDGTIVDPTKFSVSPASLAINMGGPVAEYNHNIRESAVTAVKDGEAFAYTFTKPIPETVTGSYAFSIEVRRTITVVDNPEGTADVTVVEGATNPVKIVGLGTAKATPRRAIVDEKKCNVCHDRLTMHGGQRITIDECVICHNQKGNDIGRRPADVKGGESIAMANMIHKIHTGENLSNNYTIFAYGNTPVGFNSVLFPGDRKKCDICHVTAVPTLPLPEAASNIDFFNKDGQQIIIPPTTAACTSCHDNANAIAHARLNSTPDGVESCSVCHKAGRSADIAGAHGQIEFINIIEQIGPLNTRIHTWDLY